jgi:cystathionine beta-synthase
MEMQVNNPAAHELTTGPEIIADVLATPATPARPSSMKVDAILAGAGTGGTISGLSRAIKKKHNPDCVVVALDPVRPPRASSSAPTLTLRAQKGSILALPATLNEDNGEGIAYVVEGIGYDFVPDVLSRVDGEIDEWVKTSDEGSFAAARELMRREGLLCGGSSGAALSGTLAWLGQSPRGRALAQTPGANVVVVLPDGIRNYMSKPWFLAMTMDAEPSPLAGTIKHALADENSYLAETKGADIAKEVGHDIAAHL